MANLQRRVPLCVRCKTIANTLAQDRTAHSGGGCSMANGNISPQIFPPYDCLGNEIINMHTNKTTACIVSVRDLRAPENYVQRGEFWRRTRCDQSPNNNDCEIQPPCVCCACVCVGMASTTVRPPPRMMERRTLKEQLSWTGAKHDCCLYVANHISVVCSAFQCLVERRIERSSA